MGCSAVIPRTLALLFLAALPAAAQSRAVVMVDPGHGGEQPGVQVAGLVEKELVLRAGFVLAEALVRAGYDTRLTRSGDVNPPNPDRRAAAEAAGAAAMISLHFNQNADSTRHGVEIYGNVEDARVRALAERLSAALGANGTPVVVAQRNNAFLGSTSVPTVMIEAAFLTHPVERRLAVSPAFHAELAASVVAALDAFLGRAP